MTAVAPQRQVTERQKSHGLLSVSLAGCRPMADFFTPLDFSSLDDDVHLLKGCSADFVRGCVQRI